MRDDKPSSQQIGKLGELLVQYYLLQRCIESSHLTTDKGIDLVAYNVVKRKALTIQVKTNLKPKPGGGKGKLALDWWIPKNCPADLVALVDLGQENIWLFTVGEMQDYAQQQNTKQYHLYMYSDPTVRVRKLDKDKRKFVHDFEKFKLENRIHEFFK